MESQDQQLSTNQSPPNPGLNQSVMPDSKPAVQLSTDRAANKPPNLVQHANNQPQTENHNNISAAEAQALLATTNPEPNIKPYKRSKWLIIFMVILIVAGVAAAILLKSSQSPKANSGSNSGLPTANNPLNNGGSVKSQVKYCSNPINASVVC